MAGELATDPDVPSSSSQVALKGQQVQKITDGDLPIMEVIFSMPFFYLRSYWTRPSPPPWLSLQHSTHGWAAPGQLPSHPLRFLLLTTVIKECIQDMISWNWWRETISCGEKGPICAEPDHAPLIDGLGTKGSHLPGESTEQGICSRLPGTGD